MRHAAKRITASTAGLLCAGVFGAGVAQGEDTAISVTLTDTKIALSQKTINVGAVRFTVANKAHAARKFVVAGKTTPSIGPGKKATLRVMFSAKGKYVYSSTGRGAPLKGTLVAVSPVPTGTTTGNGTGSSSTSSTAGLNACPHPVSTTVTIHMTDGNFAFSQTTIPCGTVTFVMTNAGTLEHTLSLGGGAKPGLNPGQTGTLTVNLTPGDQYWECGTFGHDDVGEAGVLVIV